MLNDLGKGRIEGGILRGFEDNNRVVRKGIKDTLWFFEEE